MGRRERRRGRERLRASRRPRLRSGGREGHRPSRRQQHHLDGGRQPRRVGRELARGVGEKGRRAAAPRPGSRVGAPVDGHGPPREQQRQRLRRGLGVEVAGPERRGPIPRPAAGRRRALRPRGRPSPGRAPCRRRSRRPGCRPPRTRAPAPGRLRAAGARRDRRAPRGPGPVRRRPRRPRRPPRSARPAPQEPPGAARGDDRRGRQPPERRQVEVVEVEVGDQRGVHGAGDAGRSGHPAQVADAPAEQRVGDKADPVEVDHRGRVPEPRQPVRPAAHPGPCASGSCSIARHPARMAWTASAPEIGPSGGGRRRGT